MRYFAHAGIIWLEIVKREVKKETAKKRWRKKERQHVKVYIPQGKDTKKGLLDERACALDWERIERPERPERPRGVERYTQS